MRVRFARLRPWHIVGIFGVLYLSLVLLVHKGDPMALVIVGTRFDPGTPTGSMGYDGQFAWQIARSPVEGWKYVDKPAYRYQRILYPAAAWLLAFGQEDRVAWVLPLLNLAALIIGTALTERLLFHYGVSRWFALAYGLNIGMLMAVRLDLTEPLAYMFVQAGALLMARGRSVPGAAAFALAGLAKEVALILVAGYALALLVRGPVLRAVRWSALAFAPFLVWQGFLYLWFGNLGVDSGGALASAFEWIPLRGWWILALSQPGWFVIMSALLLPLAILPSLAGLFLAVRRLVGRDFHPVVLALFLQALIFTFLPSSNILDPLGVSRFIIGLIVALLTFGAYTKSRRVLVYTQFWLISLAFLLGDSFLPHG